MVCSIPARSVCDRFYLLREGLLVELVLAYVEIMFKNVSLLMKFIINAFLS